jgi:hypothetical protein
LQTATLPLRAKRALVSLSHAFGLQNAKALDTSPNREHSARNSHANKPRGRLEKAKCHSRADLGLSEIEMLESPGFAVALMLGWPLLRRVWLDAVTGHESISPPATLKRLEAQYFGTNRMRRAAGIVTDL